ncbi:MAG: EAL domain-containing protein, partial [Burkholderiaceae bacterium]
MLSRFTFDSGAPGNDSPDGEHQSSWLLRGTGWILFALVTVFAAWFLSYTNSGSSATEDLTIQAIDDPAPLATANRMREKLKGLPFSDQHRTGLSAPTVWARFVIPQRSDLQERIVHILEKNIGRADFIAYAEDGTELFSGLAGASTRNSNSQRAFPGFSIRLADFLSWTPVEIVMRIEPLGITKIRAALWKPSQFTEAQSKSEQRTILLVGALMFLALYAFAAANSGRVSHFLVFGIWLLARCGFVMMESGFNYYAFGELAGTPIGIKLRQFTYLALPFATLMLVRILFKEIISGTALSSVLNVVQKLSGVLLIAALFVPFPIFQISLWVIATVTVAAVVCSLYYGLTRARDITTYWFIAGIACDALGSGFEIMNAIGLVHGNFAWFRAEQVSLIAAILTGMAVGTTLSKERQKRIDSQSNAIEVLGKYEDVYRTVPIGLVSIGVDGHILRYNEGFGRMFGIATNHKHQIAIEDRDRLPEGLEVAFPANLRQRIRQELTHGVECDFDFEVQGHESIRWLRVLARGEPDSYEASATDITAQMQLQDQLAKAAEHDPLTGALNRLGLSTRMAKILESSSDIEHIALCYIDLDRFKMLNDMFGHAAGDSVLVNVVRRIEETLGPESIISRLGGDEFIIVLPPADQSVQEGLAWKALESITEEPFALDGKSFSVTASIGVFHLVAEMSQAELIAGADRSCQEAKRKGRNQVVMCADSNQLVRQRRSELSLVARLHDESTFDEFELVAQPIVALNNSGRLACEILLRHRSESNLVPAGPLIAAAEQNGEMACIDRWVLLRTLEWLSDNESAASELRFVSVNLSGSSLNDEFFKTFVIALLQKHQHVAERIVLEVTESVAMQDIYMMVKFIEAVRQTGARIALDDFGSGYSNFASLTDVQASFLKIDGRFVNSLKEKGSAASII